MSLFLCLSGISMWRYCWESCQKSMCVWGGGGGDIKRRRLPYRGVVCRMGGSKLPHTAHCIEKHLISNFTRFTLIYKYHLHNTTFWTRQKGPMKQGLSILPSAPLSFWVFSWNCIIIFFLNFCMVLEIHLKLCMTDSDFQEKFFLPPKTRKMDQKWTKNMVF